MIGGNITANIQVCITIKNELHEDIKEWSTVHTVRGFLDLSSGDSRYNTYNSKIQESTHVFMCDFFILDKRVEDGARITINNKVYDVKLIDDPMELHQHLEIFLSLVGDANEQ